MRRLFQEELLSVNVIRCLSRRPPKVLVQDFDSAWASADAPGRKELKESVFGMLRGWAFARPDKAADRGLVQRSCHDKAEVVRKEVLSLQMWHEPGRFEELQALCTERSAAVLDDMFAIRDALAAEPGGDGHFVVEELESFGSSVLAVIPPADDLLKSGKDNAKFQAALDETVLVPLVRAHARVCVVPAAPACSVRVDSLVVRVGDRSTPHLNLRVHFRNRSGQWQSNPCRTSPNGWKRCLESLCWRALTRPRSFQRTGLDGLLVPR